MGSESVTYFTTDTADQCFLDEFVTGLGAVVQGEISTAAEMYNDIGALWYNVGEDDRGVEGCRCTRTDGGIVVGRGCPFRGGVYAGAAVED